MEDIKNVIDKSQDWRKKDAERRKFARGLTFEQLFSQFQNRPFIADVEEPEKHETIETFCRRCKNVDCTCIRFIFERDFDDNESSDTESDSEHSSLTTESDSSEASENDSSTVVNEDEKNSQESAKKSDSAYTSSSSTLKPSKYKRQSYEKYKQKHNKFSCPRPRILINGREISEEDSWAGVPHPYRPDTRKKIALNPTDIQEFTFNKSVDETQYPDYKYIIYRPNTDIILRNEARFTAATKLKLEMKCGLKLDTFLKEVESGIYGSTEGHPQTGSEDYYLAAQNYAIYGKSFLDLPQEADKCTPVLSVVVMKVIDSTKYAESVNFTQNEIGEPALLPELCVDETKQSTFLADYQAQNSYYQQTQTNAALNMPVLCGQNQQDTYQYSQTASYSVGMSKDCLQYFNVKHTSTSFWERKFTRYYAPPPLIRNPLYQIPLLQNLKSFLIPQVQINNYLQYQHVCHKRCTECICWYSQQQVHYTQ